MENERNFKPFLSRNHHQYFEQGVPTYKTANEHIFILFLCRVQYLFFKAVSILVLLPQQILLPQTPSLRIYYDAPASTTSSPLPTTVSVCTTIITTKRPDQAEPSNCCRSLATIFPIYKMSCRERKIFALKCISCEIIDFASLHTRLAASQRCSTAVKHQRAPFLFFPIFCSYFHFTILHPYHPPYFVPLAESGRVFTASSSYNSARGCIMLLAPYFRPHRLV